LQYQWQLPQSGHVKVNVDAGLKDGHAGLGIIARDAHGSVLFASSQICFHCSVPGVTKFMAMTEGLRLAIQWIDQPIVLETDCLSIRKEAKLLGDELRGLKFILYNRVVHELGQHACKDLCSKVWIKRDFFIFNLF
jgi:hypothetical protein